MTKTTEDKRLKEVKKVIEEWDTYPRETQIALESAISMARILTMIRDNEKAGQEGKVKKILIRLLLRGRKRYLDIVWVKGKAYKVEIEEFIPAEKWVAKTKKALKNAELNSKQVIFSIEEQQIPFFQ